MSTIKPVFIDKDSGQLVEPREGDTFINNPDFAFNSVQELMDFNFEVESDDPFPLSANLLGFYEVNDGGGSLVYWAPNEDKANHNGGTIIDPDHSETPSATNSLWFNSENAGTGCWKRIIDGHIPVTWFGAVADSTGPGTGTDSSIAIQAAMDNYKDVYFPNLSSGGFMAGNLNPNGRQALIGPGKDIVVLYGDMVNPTFTLGDWIPNDRTALGTIPRRWSMRNLYIENNDAPLIDVAYSPEWTLTDCTFITKDSEALNFRVCFGCTIQSCKIEGDGGGAEAAMTLYDNMNGFAMEGSTRITGGTANGAIDIGNTCHNLHIKGIVVERCLYGIRIGGNTGDGAGNVNNVTIENCYFERVRYPIRIGENNRCRVGSIKEIRVQNSFIEQPAGANLILGSAYYYDIRGFYCDDDGNNTFLELRPSNIDDRLPEHNRIEQFFLDGYTDTYDFNFNFSQRSDVIQSNEINSEIREENELFKRKTIRRGPFVNDGTQQVYPVISGSEELYGARLISAKIVNITGSLDQVVALGYVGNAQVYGVLNLDTATQEFGEYTFSFDQSWIDPRERTDFRLISGGSDTGGEFYFELTYDYCLTSELNV